MLATGRNDRQGASRRGKNGRNGQKSGADARFEVLGRVGEGTLWIVYRVKTRENGEVVALKALKNVFNRHPRFPEAVLSCCQSWRGLSHPHLSSGLEVGREDETLFLVSEWLPGGSLESRLNRALSRDEILSVLRATAGVLSYLHAQNVAHGDVRPRQFLFDAAGRLRLTDGGMAQAFAASGLALADVQPDAAWYLAPERTQGASLAPPADLYALGVMLYRMLAGRVPFDGPSPLAIALRHRSDAPLPPSQLNPRCPADLEAVALRLLEKDPQRRLTAPELEAHLVSLQTPSAQTRSAPITSGASAMTPPVAALSPSAALAAAVPVAALGIAAPAEDATAVPLTAEVPPAVATAVSADAAVVSNPAISVPLPAPSSAPPVPSSAPDAVIAVDIPRARPLSPLVEETLAAQKEEEVQLDRDTVRRRFKRREFWGAFAAFFWLLIVGGAFGGMLYGAYYYWLQDSPRQVRVPNYLGLDQKEAKQRLAKAGLTLRIGRETYDAKKPAGTVVSGQPEPERLVRSRREVTVTISQGEAPITMVNFAELPLAQARAIIAQHAMRLGPVGEQFHDKVPRGFICGQFPESGEAFRRSDPITLIVSRGPQPSEIDARTGALPPLEGAAPGDESGDESGTASGAEFQAPSPDFQAPPTTIEGEGDTDQAAISRIALIRVLIPADGGSQLLRVIVRDADGERVVYSKTHRAGDEVEERVRVRRPQGATALVRVYVGQALIKEERL